MLNMEKIMNQHFCSRSIYVIFLCVISFCEFAPSSSSSRELYMGISTYDPFNNLEYIFASPTQSSNFSKDGRLFQVEYNSREFNMVLLEPWNTAFTSIEFDPTTSSLLGTYNAIGKPPEFGQVDLTTGVITSYGSILEDYTLKIGVSAFDSFRRTYYICGRKKEAFNDGDVIIKINLLAEKNNTHTIRKMSVLKPDVNNLPALEIVQLEVNTKYNNVNVLQAVALDLIFADKNSNKKLGWKKMMLDYGDEEFPSTSVEGNNVKQSAPIRKEKSTTMLKELEKLFIGPNSSASIDILDHLNNKNDIILSTDDYNMTEPVPVNSGMSLFIKAHNEFKSFLSADSLGPAVAPQFADGYPKLIAATIDGYALGIMTNKIAVVSIVAVNAVELKNLRNVTSNATVVPLEENVVTIGKGLNGNSEFLDGIRSGEEVFIRKPSDLVTVTINKIPCNTDIQIFYISRYGFKAKTSVEKLKLSGGGLLPRIGCNSGHYCPNTHNLGKGLDTINEECKPCDAGEYQPVENSITSSCSSCTPGFVQPMSGQSSCIPCPLGTESGNSTLECTPCPIGFFAACTNTSKCSKCPKGQTTWETGSFECVTERIVLPAPRAVEVIIKTKDTVCVHWVPPLESTIPIGIDNVTTYVVAQSLISQFTLDEAYKQDVSTCDSAHNCSYCFKPNNLMYKAIVYVRVAAMIKGSGIGAASATSEGWKIAKDCGNDRYLDDSSNALKDWKCQECPRGADCTGDILWNGVRAKFGYYRLDEIDRRGTKELFWPCVNPKACLGGKNILLAGKYFDEDGNDMALLDGPETCNYDLGFEINCGDKYSNDTTLHKTCRLCRACKPGYWEAGVGECIACPSEWLNTVVVLFALLFIVLIVSTFLRTALKQNREDLNHSHHHYGQSLKKIVINHLQLISLATGFPLKWPDVMSNYFRFINVFGSAGEYIFNPSCSIERRGTDAIKSSTFFLHQMTVLSLPLICIAASGCFWGLVALNNCFKENQIRERNRRAKARLSQRGFMLGFDKDEARRKKKREATRANLLQVKAAWEQKTSPQNSPKHQKKNVSSTAVLPSNVIRRGNTLNLQLLNKQIKKKIKISTFDKFLMSSVTLLYLLYPTLCKATFSMNACRYVGDVEYLIMDMSINCNGAEHMTWIYNLWFPSIFLYVLVLPFTAWLLLYRSKKSLNEPRITFRLGILFGGYIRSAYYWESIIALRKASIILISAVFSILGTEAQALVAILTTLGFALLHLQYRPFVRVVHTYDTLDAAESWSLIVAILTLWCGLFYFQDVASTGEIPVVLTFVLMGINIIYFMVVLRWFLIFKLMDLHSARRKLPVGQQRSGFGGTVMVLMEHIVPSWVSRTAAKWRHGRAKLRVIVKLILYVKAIRQKREKAQNAQRRKKHLKYRNLRKEDLLPHRSRISGVRSRMRKIELLKAKLLPFAKDGKSRSRDPTRVTPIRQSGRFTPTRIYPMGIPTPSIGRRTPTPSRRLRMISPQSRSGSRSRISPTPSRTSSRNSRSSRSRLRSPMSQKTSLLKISPASNLRNKSRKEQAQLMQVLAVKRLAQRQKAMEARERKLEEMKNDPQFVHLQKIRKLKVAVDTQQVAKHGLRRMLEKEVGKLSSEKAKLRAQIEKLMKLGRSKKLSRPQVEKLKQTMKLLKDKYEAIIKKEKAVQTRLKHI